MLNFLKFRYLYFVISGCLLVTSIFFLVRYGLRPSVDFTGGSELEIKVSEELSSEQLKEQLSSNGIDFYEVASSGPGHFVIRAKPWEEGKKSELLGKLRTSLGEVEELRFETIGPTAGRELLTKTLAAVTLTTILILVYLAWQLKNWVYGLGAILGMLHDSLILLGVFSVLGHFWGIEVDTLFVTAVLTTLSFSVHDTVVIYNSVREALRRGLSTQDAVNTALTRTIIRSLNNSWTIMFMLLALVLLGGETIRWFVAALLVGTVLGTYSSTFLATPLLVSLTAVFQKTGKKK